MLSRNEWKKIAENRSQRKYMVISYVVRKARPKYDRLYNEAYWKPVTH